jgi:hypothetical protein
MILAAFAFGAFMLLMTGVLTVIYFHNRPQCSESVASESASPDGQWRAAVMERHCGDESPLYVHVNLRAAGEAIDRAYFSGRSEQGEIFVAEEETRATAPTLAWNSPRRITIRCPWCRPGLVRQRLAHWGPIAVEYQLQP